MEMALSESKFEGLEQSEMFMIDGGKVTKKNASSEKTFNYIAGGLMVAASCCALMNPATAAAGAMGLEMAAALFF